MGFYKNDATAANNTALNGINAQGGASPQNIDNLIRELAAQGKQFALDIGGATTVGGTADAITISANDSVADAYFDGMVIGFVAGSDNATTTPTANVNSIGAEPIKKALATDGAETALAAGDIQSGGLYLLRWRSAWDSGGGAWQLIDLQHGAAGDGSESAPSISFASDPDTGFYRPASDTVALSIGGTTKAAFALNAYVIGNDTFEPVGGFTNGWQQQGTTGGQASFYNIIFRNSATACPTMFLAKSRGSSFNTHAIVQSGDILGSFEWYASNGSSWDKAASIRAEVDGTPGASADMPGRIVFSTSPDGSATIQERVRIDNAGNVQMGGANTVIDSNRHHQLRSYTVAGLPSAATAGQMIFVSNESGGAVPAFSDGTNWRRVTDRAIVS